MGRMWIAAGLVGALVGCADDAPAYDLTLTYTIWDATGIEVLVDDGPAELTVRPEAVYIRIERGYDSYATSGGAARVGFEVRRDGTVLWTHEEDPKVCEYFADECGMIVAADYQRCFQSDGSQGGLCGSLDCYEEDGHCGGWISSAPLEPPAQLPPVPARQAARGSRANGGPQP